MFRFAGATVGARQGSLSALLVATLLVAAPAADVEAQQKYAHKKRQETAVAHYSRARTMLVAALEEFEQGRRYARPDVLVDSEDWRLKVVSLTEELNRLIDPQVKVTREGVRTKGNPRLIRREFQALPPVPDGARDGNFYGEQQRAKELQAARAERYGSQSAPEPVEEDDAALSSSAPSPGRDSGAVFPEDDEGLEDDEEASLPASPQDLSEGGAVAKARQSKYDAPDEEPSDAAASTNRGGQQAIPEDLADELEVSPTEGGGEDEEEVTSNANEGTDAEELSEEGRAASADQEVASQIDEAIQEKLKSLEVGADNGAGDEDFPDQEFDDTDQDRIQ